MSNSNLTDQVLKAKAASQKVRTSVDQKSKAFRLVSWLNVLFAMAFMVLAWEYFQLKDSHIDDNIHRSISEVIIEADAELMRYYQLNGKLPESFPEPNMALFLDYQKLSNVEYQISLPFYDKQEIKIELDIRQTLDPYGLTDKIL